MFLAILDANFLKQFWEYFKYVSQELDVHKTIKYVVYLKETNKKIKNLAEVIRETSYFFILKAYF